MPPNANEAHVDEEEIIQGDNEALNYNQEVVRKDEERKINSAGSLKGVIESHLQADESLTTRELLRCETLTTNKGNVLKQAMESLLMPLQVVHYEFISEILDATLETIMLKEKAENLHQNQIHNRNTPKGSTASFEPQVKQHAKRVF